METEPGPWHSGIAPRSGERGERRKAMETQRPSAPCRSRCSVVDAVNAGSNGDYFLASPSPRVRNTVVNAVNAERQWRLKDGGGFFDLFGESGTR